ncbi:hypothetical protein ENBRE01_3057 [Enteropsectra breve]|nr:hypothetical protein ENBRE01_3057 [Enteropsectra breve]
MVQENIFTFHSLETPVVKRQSYTVKYKLAALSLLRSNLNNISKTAFQLKITCKMLRDWKNKESLLNSSAVSAQSKSIGSGRKPLYIELETKLKEWVTVERRVYKRLINYATIQRKIEEFELEDSAVYPKSGRWINGFLKRNSLSVRQITHVGQEDNSTPDLKKTVALNWLEKVNRYTESLSSRLIFNMDETPIYVDMAGSRTISFLGEKTTEIVSTGSTKTRLSVVLCMNKSGELSKTMVIIKGLKRVPKVNIPDNIFLAVAKGGSMNSELMKSWIENCFDENKNSEHKVLIMDEHASHTSTEVNDLLREKNTTALIIPPRTTYYLQPLDVLVNAIFKAEMRRRWNEWMAAGEVEYTPKGYRRRPGWQLLVNWVSESVCKLSQIHLIKSFTLCGIRSEHEIPLEEACLNTKLQSIISGTSSFLLEEDDNDEMFILNTEIDDM